MSYKLCKGDVCAMTDMCGLQNPQLTASKEDLKITVRYMYIDYTLDIQLTDVIYIRTRNEL